jgi:hypothetical protein
VYNRIWVFSFWFMHMATAQDDRHPLGRHADGRRESVVHPMHGADEVGAFTKRTSLANYHSLTLPFYDLALYLGVVLSGLLVAHVSMLALLSVLVVIDTVAVLVYVPVFFAKRSEPERSAEETYL